MKCDNVEGGCGWEGTVGTLEEHLVSCGYIQVPCPNECKEDDKVQMITRKDLNQHLKEHCVNRDYECEHCKKKATYAYITGLHDSLCEKKVLPCPNTECDDTVERAKIEEHLKDNCKYTVISCKYKSIGCDVKMKRKDMGTHEQDDKIHLHQALDIVIKLQHDLQSVTTTTSKVREENEERAVKLAKNIKSMKKENNAKGVKLQSAKNVLASMKKERDDMSMKLQSTTKSIASMKKKCGNRVAKLKKENEDMAVKFKKENDFRAVELQSATNIMVYMEQERDEMAAILKSTRKTISMNRMCMEWESGIRVLQKGDWIKFKLSDVRKVRTRKIYQSQSFYTCIDGYNFRIIVNLNKIAVHSLFNYIYMSVTAKLLEEKWPFIGTIELMLLNQVEECLFHKKSILDNGSTWHIPITDHRKLTLFGHYDMECLKDDFLYLKVSIKHQQRLKCHSNTNPSLLLLFIIIIIIGVLIIFHFTNAIL